MIKKKRKSRLKFETFILYSLRIFIISQLNQKEFIIQ